MCTNTSLSKQVLFNDFCHANGIYFLSAEIRGLFGYAFNDFGSHFIVTDQTGEEPISGLISDISHVRSATRLLPNWSYNNVV